MNKSVLHDGGGALEHSASILKSGVDVIVSVASGLLVMRRLFRRRRRSKPQTPTEEALQAWLTARRATAPPQFALCMGITDYGSYSSTGRDVPSLPWCAEDARRMGSALAAGGVSVTCLTDRDVTLPAVRTWLAETAAEAQSYPGTVVWLFFSGHGVRSRPARTNVDESDQRQDALLLADGPLADDVLAGLIGALPETTRLVVVLDACHSAGLMPEVVGRDGPTLFLASSDEDATSQVAAEYETGGYLSYSVIRALAEAGGQAMTAGDLQDAILGTWATVCRHGQSVYEVLGQTSKGRQWPTVIRTSPRGIVISGV